MAAKIDQNLKRQRKLEKRALVDKITNRCMINLAWGILGFLILRYLENPLMMNMTATQTALKISAIIFGVATVALVVLGFATKAGKVKCIKNTQRPFHYAIFSAVVALVALYLGFYHIVRNLVISVIPSLGSLVTQWWTTNILSVLIGVYLVVVFVYTAVKVSLIERKK